MVRVVQVLSLWWLLTFIIVGAGPMPAAQAVQPQPLPLPADEATLADIRAAYLVTVARRVTWPDEERRAELTIGILGESPVYDAIASTPLEPIRHMRVNVISLTRSSQVPQADLVYVSPRASGAMEQVFSLATRHNVLIVTEDRAIRDRMMINLTAEREMEVNYQVNPARIQLAGITPSNELLEVTGRELEVVAAQHRAQREVMMMQIGRQELIAYNQELREEIEQLQERIDVLEQNLRERDEVLRAQRGTLEDKQLVMESQQDTLNQLLEELQEQRNLLFTREEQLNHIQRQLASTEAQLGDMETELERRELQLEAKEREGQALAQRISSNRDILAAQQQQLRDQRAALSEQAALLETRERTIDRQREYLIYILIALGVALLLGILSLTLYVKKRRTATQLMETLNELHEAQDKLVESEKMAALGNLVAGVAHEVNTPLGVALTATSMLNDRRELLHNDVLDGRLTRDQLERFLEQSKESLSLTEKNLSRVARLISNFKQVAVDQMVTERRTINVGNYIEEIMSALSIELKRAHIEYQIEVEGDIDMDTIPGAMAQILTNLVTNSIRHGYQPLGPGEKLSNGETRGTISVRAQRAEGDRVKILFCDDGLGMDPDTVQKIFEPFFTTKRNEGGTGLGMPIVYNLVRQQLKGDISVRSKEGEGTCFELLLPRHLKLSD